MSGAKLGAIWQALQGTSAKAALKLATQTVNEELKRGQKKHNNKKNKQQQQQQQQQQHAIVGAADARGLSAAGQQALALRALAALRCGDAQLAFSDCLSLAGLNQDPLTAEALPPAAANLSRLDEPTLDVLFRVLRDLERPDILSIVFGAQADLSMRIMTSTATKKTPQMISAAHDALTSALGCHVRDGFDWPKVNMTAMRLFKLTDKTKWLVVAAAAQNWQVNLGAPGLWVSVLPSDMAGATDGGLAVTNGVDFLAKASEVRAITDTERKQLSMAAMLWMRAFKADGVKTQADAEVYADILQKLGRYRDLISLLESGSSNPAAEDNINSSEFSEKFCRYFSGDVHGTRDLIVATCYERLGEFNSALVVYERMLTERPDGIDRAMRYLNCGVRAATSVAAASSSTNSAADPSSSGPVPSLFLAVDDFFEAARLLFKRLGDADPRLRGPPLATLLLLQMQLTRACEKSSKTADEDKPRVHAIGEGDLSELVSRFEAAILTYIDAFEAKTSTASDLAPYIGLLASLSRDAALRLRSTIADKLSAMRSVSDTDKAPEWTVMHKLSHAVEEALVTGTSDASTNPGLAIQAFADYRILQAWQTAAADTSTEDLAARMVVPVEHIGLQTIEGLFMDIIPPKRCVRLDHREMLAALACVALSDRVLEHGAVAGSPFCSHSRLQLCALLQTLGATACPISHAPRAAGARLVPPQSFHGTASCVWADLGVKNIMAETMLPLALGSFFCSAQLADNKKSFAGVHRIGGQFVQELLRFHRESRTATHQYAADAIHLHSLQKVSEFQRFFGRCTGSLVGLTAACEGAWLIVHNSNALHALSAESFQAVAGAADELFASGDRAFQVSALTRAMNYLADANSSTEELCSLSESSGGPFSFNSTVDFSGLVGSTRLLFADQARMLSGTTAAPSLVQEADASIISGAPLRNAVGWLRARALLLRCIASASRLGSCMLANSLPDSVATVGFDQYVSALSATLMELGVLAEDSTDGTTNPIWEMWIAILHATQCVSVLQAAYSLAQQQRNIEAAGRAQEAAGHAAKASVAVKHAWAALAPESGGNGEQSSSSSNSNIHMQNASWLTGLPIVMHFVDHGLAVFGFMTQVAVPLVAVSRKQQKNVEHWTFAVRPAVRDMVADIVGVSEAALSVIKTMREVDSGHGASFVQVQLSDLEDAADGNNCSAMRTLVSLMEVEEGGREAAERRFAGVAEGVATSWSIQVDALAALLADRLVALRAIRVI